MNEVNQALYGALTAGTALTALLAGTTSVYHQLVPAGAVFDCVVFQQQGGGEENQTQRRSKNLLYTVKGISAQSAQNAGAIDAQIDTLLHGQTLTVSGWTAFWLSRETDVEYVETTPEGRHYWHAGAVYRIRLCE